MEGTECSRSATTAAPLASQRDREGVQGTQHPPSLPYPKVSEIQASLQVKHFSTDWWLPAYNPTYNRLAGRVGEDSTIYQISLIRPPKQLEAY